MNSFFEAFDLFEVITRSFATTSGHIFSHLSQPAEVEFT